MFKYLIINHASWIYIYMILLNSLLLLKLLDRFITFIEFVEMENKSK
jgi:hypothetical protein